METTTTITGKEVDTYAVNCELGGGAIRARRSMHWAQGAAVHQALALGTGMASMNWSAQ